jgi:hypothetical protein
MVNGNGIAQCEKDEGGSQTGSGPDRWVGGAADGCEGGSGRSCGWHVVGWETKECTADLALFSVHSAVPILSHFPYPQIYLSIKPHCYTSPPPLELKCWKLKLLEWT